MHEFKYLGLLYHEVVEYLHKPNNTHYPWPDGVSLGRKYTCCIDHRIKQAKARLACWMRRCKVWLLPVDVAATMFSTCVMPALEYSVHAWVWGGLD